MIVFSFVYSLFAKIGFKRSIEALRRDLKGVWYLLRIPMIRGRGVKLIGGGLDQLHLGCGKRQVLGWLNVDYANSDLNLDLSCLPLPLPDSCFRVICSQQVIEHFELDSELVPLLRELWRVAKPGCELWISCPSIEKICDAYQSGAIKKLIDARKRRFPSFEFDYPESHFVNELFHQSGEHKNLFDFELLSFTLNSVGFGQIDEMVESDFLERFPEFPARDDDEHSLYVRCRKVDLEGFK